MAPSAATVSQGPFHLRRGQRLLLLPSGTDPQLRQEQAQKRDDDTDVRGTAPMAVAWR